MNESPITTVIQLIKGALSGLRQFLVTENSLKVIKTAC